ncbi:hypothetical protein SAMN05660653_00148 [Desulfonatronum thiosulfatophilum]|uniref:Uncharacterized protein n=1 Tax=Desulfonatronum thiosulfatophilum TaxID=617002 RepID=A0A1G6A5R7_9BACT|nr:hypothetical protein [Desulfonatronum thiosulfatophilum]SDB03373.1 hypothetical protein SAMN05660653_00148 [Desulfonatronum thiosulfatophilum]
MTKKKARTDRGQLQLPLDLHREPVRAGGYRVRDAVQEALRETLEKCPISREDLAEEMSRVTGESVTVNHLNSWTAASKQGWRFPLEFAAAMAMITGNTAILDAALSVTGFRVVSVDDLKIMEFGRLTLEEKKRASRKRALMEELL